MFYFTDLFQWERFVTPSIIKVFYWLSVVMIVLLGAAGIATALATMSISFVPGFLMLTASFFAMVIGVIFARIAAEFILIVFRINEHLGALRARGGM